MDGRDSVRPSAEIACCQRGECGVSSGSFKGKVSSLCLKLVHDKLNNTPITVTNSTGDSWPTMGDQAVAKTPETQRIAALAVQTSRQAVEENREHRQVRAARARARLIPVTAQLASGVAKPIDTFARDATMFTGLLRPQLLDASINNPLYQLIKDNLGLGPTRGKEWAGER